VYNAQVDCGRLRRVKLVAVTVSMLHC